MADVFGNHASGFVPLQGLDRVRKVYRDVSGGKVTSEEDQKDRFSDGRQSQLRGSHASNFVLRAMCIDHTRSYGKYKSVIIAYTLRIAVVAVALATSSAAIAEPATIGAVKNIVLVHGANTDGSGWRGVHDILTKKGYQVSVVQQPLTGLVDDVAATRRVIDQQDGPVILVGHSYGGTIITVAGADPKVRALVYVAALQPDVGETTGQLAASIPGDVPDSDLRATNDGFIFVNPAKFAADVAADLPPAQAKYMANSQMPVAAAAFSAPVSVAAWRDKPSYGIVATADRALNPKLARWMYRRSGAEVTEIKGSHLIYISRPNAVASVIERAARSISESTTKPR